MVLSRAMNICIILLTIFSYLISLATYAYEIPDLGEHSATILTPQKEKQMGKEFMQIVRLNTDILDDDIINDYIQKLGDKLASNSKVKNKKFHFFVILNPSINAFAGPDGNVGVYSGIIAATNSEDELAAVMAHEIAHVAQHHIEYLIERVKNTQITATATALAALIIGVATGAGNAATGATMASIGGAHQHLINFTKAKEIEADHIAMKILQNSGFDPESMSNFFERVQKLTYDYNQDQITTHFSTHPTTNDRIAESKDRFKQLVTKQFTNQNTYNLLHARLQVFSLRNTTDAVRFFKNQLANNPKTNTTALQYGYALALYKDHQLPQAIRIINDLQKKYPNEILFQMAAAQINLANKQPDAAINILKNAINIHPNYKPLFMQYAQTLINAGHSQAACNFLRFKVIQDQNNAALYRLLAKSFAQNNHKIDAYQAQARSYEIEGYYQQAIAMLQQALKETKLNPTEKSIIHAKIKRLQNTGR